MAETSETYTPRNLRAGGFPIVTASDTLDAGDLSAGAVLGKITTGAVPTEGTADAGNTGDGTLTVVTGGKNTKIGVYTVKCVEAITNGGRFDVIDPDGIVLGSYTILAGAGGVIAFVTAQINGTITDAATDFALDDEFTVTVAAGSGKVVIVLSTNIDGSQNPYGVLLDDSDASSADQVVAVALSGEFDENTLSYGGSDVNATHKTAMRALNLYQKPALAL